MVLIKVGSAPLGSRAVSTPEEPARTGDLDALVDAVPEGWSPVDYRGRRYGLSRTSRAGGRAVSVLAHELGGSDVISANVYRVADGSGLRPCEMPAEKVLGFLRGWRSPAERTPGTDPAGPRRPRLTGLPAAAGSG